MIKNRVEYLLNKHNYTSVTDNFDGLQNHTKRKMFEIID